MCKFAKVKSIIPINNVLTIYEIKKKKKQNWTSVYEERQSHRTEDRSVT